MNLDYAPLRPESTAPWPAIEADDGGTFWWLRPGELLAFPVPTVALQLDAVLRHLEIDGEFSDLAAAAIHLAQARATWQRLEPALASRAAERTHLRDACVAAKELGACLDGADGAVKAASAAGIMAHARRAIELVDSIERAFE